MNCGCCSHTQNTLPELLYVTFKDCQGIFQTFESRERKEGRRGGGQEFYFFYAVAITEQLEKHSSCTKSHSLVTVALAATNNIMVTN